MTLVSISNHDANIHSLIYSDFFALVRNTQYEHLSKTAKHWGSFVSHCITAAAAPHAMSLRKVYAEVIYIGKL